MSWVNIALIYDHSNTDAVEYAKLVDNWLVSFGDSKLIIRKPRHSDIHSIFVHSDINIHIGMVVYSAVNWAYTNILIKNSTDWPDAFVAYEHAFDAIIERSDVVADADVFMSKIVAVQPFLSERKPKSGNHACPPILMPCDCPPISIVTPTFNRRRLINIAFHNLVSSDYPKDKIEWVVVEDGEKQEDMASDAIIGFRVNNPEFRLKYIPLSGKYSIGHKRNLGVEHASSDIILFMDDDDHDPPTAFRRRVAWLTKSRFPATRLTCCTSIAMYDLQTGQSGVNVPPWDLPFSKRISEATLTFYKSLWTERPFPDTSVSEGSDWIVGRESVALEMPPQQIIVAFNHDQSQTRRRIPKEAPVGCFWGFPKEYLQFIHRLVGVEIEEDKSDSKKNRLKKS